MSAANGLATRLSRTSPNTGPLGFWPVPACAVLAALLSVASVHAVVYLFRAYTRGGALGPEGVEFVLMLVRVVFHRGIFFGLTALAAYLALRASYAAARIPRRSTAYLVGASVGAVAGTVMHLYVYFVYYPPDYAESAILLALAVAGGLLGAAAGRRSLAGDAALRAAREGVGLAQTPEEMARALWRHLDGPLTELTIWRLDRGVGQDEPDGARPLRVWATFPPAAAGRVTPPPEADPGLLGALQVGPVLTNTRELAHDARRGWRAGGAGGLFRLELRAPAAEGRTVLIGVLAVTLPAPRVSRQCRILLSKLAPEAAKNLNYAVLVAERAAQDVREKLCTEIHDTVANLSAAIDKQLVEVERGESALSAEGRRRLGLARESARQQHKASRDLMRALHPADDAASHLDKLLAEEVAGWERRTGHRARFRVSGLPQPLRQDANVALFGVVREGLNNVDKHAGLSPGEGPPVDVSITYAPDTVRLVVADAGSGFDVPPGPRTAEPTETGYGLGSLDRAIAAAGGVLQTESAPGRGARLVAAIPVRPPRGRHPHPPAAAGGTTQDRDQGPDRVSPASRASVVAEPPGRGGETS